MKHLTIILLLVFGAHSQAQFLDSSDFHSEFEQKVFERLTKGLPTNPGLFYFTVEAENDFEDYSEFQSELMVFQGELEKKLSSIQDERKKLRKFHRLVQNRYFKFYELYSPFSNIYEEGVYNCISGTALYAMLLDGLGFEVNIQETPHHSFLTAIGEEGNYLFETTDSDFGFMWEEEKIYKRINDFHELTPEESTIMGMGSEVNDDLNKYSFVREVSMRELAGLQYYNSGIVAFNNGDYKEASRLLKKATYLYPTERIITLQIICDEYMLSSN